MKFRNVWFCGVAVLFLLACSEDKRIEKGVLSEGMEYTIVHTLPSATPIKPNHIVKALQSIKLGDSEVVSMKVGLPSYQKVSSAIDAKKKFDLISLVLLHAQKGDTIFSEQTVASIKQHAYLPVDLNDSLKYKTKMVVLDVFDNRSEAQQDKENEMRHYIEKEKQEFKAFLSSKHIEAEEADGIFIERIAPPTSPESPLFDDLCKDSCGVEVRYEGRLLNGRIFDETYTHLYPFRAKINTGQLIEGFERAIKKMRVGETINAYIPSMLGYKEYGNKTREVKPFQPVIFRITLLSVRALKPS